MRASRSASVGQFSTRLPTALLAPEKASTGSPGLTQRSSSINGSNMTTERGIVVRAAKNGLYSEYAFDCPGDLSAEALAEEILPETADTGFGETELVFTPAEIYEKAIQQVVGIRSEFTMTNFFGMSSSGAVSGTGFIVNPDGYILTNYHVVEDAYKRHLSIDVMTYDGEKNEAAIVGVEPGNDIAVLKIEAEGLVNVYSHYINEQNEIGTLARSYTELIEHNNHYIENIQN